MVDFDQEEEEDALAPTLATRAELDSLAAEVYQLKRRKIGGLRWFFIGFLSAFLGMVGGVFGRYYIPTMPQPAVTVGIRSLQQNLKETRELLGGPFPGIGVLDELNNRIYALEMVAKTKGEVVPKAEKSTTQPTAPSAKEAARAARIEALRE